MSFLDRFQGKIATVTAHGHLKKADGSEEIRVGLPKRKPNGAAQQPSARTSSNQTAIAPPERAGPQRHVPQQYPPPDVPRVVIPPGSKAHSTIEKTASARQQPQYPSPQSSPRHKSGRDGYDAYGYDRDNNSHHRQQQQLQGHGALTHRQAGYDYQASLPGRAMDDHYDDHYGGAQRRGAGGHSPVKGASPERYNAGYDKSPSHYDRPRDRSPVHQQHPQQQQREPPSPRERNEARVQSDEDQLAFSRRARPVQFAPCTVAQYKKEKPAGYYELGKLQPDLNSEDLVQKRANRERIKAFSKNLRDINKTVAVPKKADDDAAQKKTMSTREKALAFAKHIPKPRLQQRPLAEPSGSLGTSDSNDELDVEVPTAAARRPINSIEDDESEEDHVSSELQQLQMRHQASRAQVEALIRGT